MIYRDLDTSPRFSSMSSKRAGGMLIVILSTVMYQERSSMVYSMTVHTPTLEETCRHKTTERISGNRHKATDGLEGNFRALPCGAEPTNTRGLGHSLRP